MKLSKQNLNLLKRMGFKQLQRFPGFFVDEDSFEFQISQVYSFKQIIKKSNQFHSEQAIKKFKKELQIK